MSEQEQSQSIPIASEPVTPILRPYQQKFIADVYAQIRAGVKRVLGFSPTGSGKTLIGSQIVQHAVSKGKHVLFVLHRDILVQQTAEKLSAFGITPGFIKSGWTEDRNALVQVASVQTMAKRGWWRQYPAKVVILDEVHRVWSKPVGKLVAFNRAEKRQSVVMACKRGKSLFIPSLPYQLVLTAPKFTCWHTLRSYKK